MAKFIEVTVADGSLFLNVDAIAELKPKKTGTEVTMLWARDLARPAVHFVKEAIGEVLARITEATFERERMATETRRARVKALAEEVRANGSPPPAQG